MKPATKKSIAKLPEKKPLKRWRKRAFAVLDSWSSDHRDLTLIYGAQNCRVQQQGRLVKTWEGTYCFIKQSQLRVFLYPDEWKSLHFEENAGVALVIDGGVGDGGLILRESSWARKDHLFNVPGRRLRYRHQTFMGDLPNESSYLSGRGSGSDGSRSEPLASP
jgi:hypothetical protein